MRRSVPVSHKRPAALGTFYYGSPYYPEHWDKEVREGDGALMREAGWNMVRMGEFAWDLMEPREGEYDFSLFDETIEALGKEGIVSMLCTPTATPPRWLTARHPEILRVDADGVVQEHGSRQHVCTTGYTFRRYSRGITQAMADHFQDNPHVVGWQTDNELHCHFSRCHCEECRRGFREYLKLRYEGDIAELNRAWGTSFWAQSYSSFEQISTPRDRKPAYLNPAHQLDYFRFLSWATARFQREQVEILRRARPSWFITHNGLFGHIDYRGDFGQDLDVLGYDVYPMFENDPDLRRFRQAYGCDHARGWSGNFFVPEQQSGPGGQAPYFHDNPEPGEMRKMAYVSIARGADSLLFFRWRTCRFGAEEYWCGIVDHDNVPRRRYREAAQLGEELKRVGPALLGTHVHADIGIAGCDQSVYDAHETLPFGLPHPREVGAIIHSYYYDRGYALAVAHPTDDLHDFAVYFVPHWTIFDPAWLRNLERYVEQGGILVVGARTATRSTENNVVEQTPPGDLRRLVGAAVEEYGRRNDPDARPLSILCDGESVKAIHWYEILEPDKGTETLCTWQGRYLDGRAAVTLRRKGRGAVLYVGTYFTPALCGALHRIIARLTTVSPLWEHAPWGVEVVRREGEGKTLWFFINHSDVDTTLAVPPAGEELIRDMPVDGVLHLSPNGVAVIRSVSG